MRTSEINQRFVEYFMSENYQLLPRAPMLDDSIPMSFVMSAGLVQVEQSLLKAHAKDRTKFVLVQDCFRHFDLEKVGTDDIHLSIFQMPGAFRFGENNKSNTVQQMWLLATSILGVDEDKLWASYFCGGDVLGNKMPEDVDTRDAWLRMGLSKERVIPLGVNDNYWLQGKGYNGTEIVRKSGPNTELFFDRGMERSCDPQCRPGCKCGRFIEFSNSLFIQYAVNNASGKFEKLGEPFSETVIGTERVAMILQDKKSVFEIDAYIPLIELVRKFSKKVNVGRGLVNISERIIADHLRALVYLISDNAPPPGKNGRQRLIKKLIRGLITGTELLGITDSQFMEKALDIVMGSIDNKSIIKDEIHQQFNAYYEMQEGTFMATIERGRKRLAQHLDCNHEPAISGDDIVYFEKKMGLPNLLIARDLIQWGIPYSESEYKRALSKWKESIVSR